MAQLRNRPEWEALVQRRIDRVFARARSSYVREIGKKHPAKVPQRYWDKVRREFRDELEANLIILFTFAAIQHGATADDIMPYAKRFARQRAREVSELVTDGSRTRLDLLGESLPRDMEKFIESAKGAGAIPKDDSSNWLLPGGLLALSAGLLVLARLGRQQLEPQGIDLPGPLSSEGVLGVELEKTYGKTRSEVITITEVTTAATNGGGEAIRQGPGFSDGDLWITMYDARVCPICRPMHGKDRLTWGRLFPGQPLSDVTRFEGPGGIYYDEATAERVRQVGGPPAHVRCRCYLAYANTPEGQRAIRQVKRGYWPDEIERLRRERYGIDRAEWERRQRRRERRRRKKELANSE